MTSFCLYTCTQPCTRYSRSHEFHFLGHSLIKDIYLMPKIYCNPRSFILLVRVLCLSVVFTVNLVLFCFIWYNLTYLLTHLLSISCYLTGFLFTDIQ